jgi:4-amino-4-deoxy-L-arabinose transferase-like glycosyltransferase
MARSLTVSTEETPSANWLLTGFVLLGIAFLALGTVATMAFADDGETPAAVAR